MLKPGDKARVVSRPDAYYAEPGSIVTIGDVYEDLSYPYRDTEGALWAEAELEAVE